MMKRFAMFAMAAGLMLGANSVYAQCSGEKASHCSGKEKSSCCSQKKGATLSQMKIVTKGQLTTLLQKGNVTVVDARDENSFASGHINGAINFTKASLPTDKSTKLVFYCGSERCPLSTQAAKKAIEMGYTNVMVYRGGWSDWNKNS